MLPNDHNPETDPQEAARAIGMLLRAGTVAQVDHATARVRFTTGDITTDWLPWFEMRAGGQGKNRTWRPPSAGEQGLMLAPGGELGRAFILPGVFSDGMPAGANTEGTVREDFNGTDFWQWKDGKLACECADEIAFKVGGATFTIGTDSIRMEAGGATLELAGSLVTASTDVVAEGISLTKHKHTGVMVGPMPTGLPIP